MTFAYGQFSWRHFLRMAPLLFKGVIDLPVIGITGGVLNNAGPFPGYHRSYVNEDYVTAIKQNGGVPFIIPINYDLNSAPAIMRHLDGLVISGGQDVDPSYYGEEPSQQIGETWATRDAFEISLLRAASHLHKPVLGICRGLQLINVARGGSLYQDLSAIPGNPYQHAQKGYPGQTSQTANLAAGSQLRTIFGQESIRINSFHHQAVKEVGLGLTVTARAKDGVIEGLEDPHNQVLAVQWHPEMLHNFVPEMNKLFRAFVIQASKGDLA